MKRWWAIIALAVPILGCGELWKLVPIDPGSKPVIVDSHAQQDLRPGAVWKIFIEAEDKDGDMKDIVSAIAPAGGSFLHYSIIAVREPDRGSLTGYLFVRTPVSAILQGEKFTVTIHIRDQAGRKSQPIGFLLRFTSRGDGELPQKWQEGSGNRLGGIFSEYFSSYVRELTSPRE